MIYPELYGCSDRALSGMHPKPYPLYPRKGLFMLQQFIEPSAEDVPLPYFAALMILDGKDFENALAFEQAAQEYVVGLTKHIFWTYSSFHYGSWAERNPQSIGPEITLPIDYAR